ncbi:hypothetical protein [Frigidibacter sp. SD6-1]|uniref:Npun_F0296 family exosortase-dependent surface protein n=1 Tax=Frigidibacter sp. SD6-1 TaxID=3032581 RepID=UPI0024DF8974|nr:hypothetical protein [Frigidibacter sp. SD6-1]
MSLRLVAGLILALAPLSAQALTVQTVATNDTAWNMVNTSQTVTLPNGATWTSAPLQMPNAWFPQVDPCISFCSPFDPGIYGTNQTIGATPLPGWQNLPFWATWQTADRSNVNTLSFSGIQKGLSLLWGSFDVGNLIEFVLNGVVVGSVAGDQLGLQVGNPGQGAALVSLTGIQFDELRFSSTLGGFEYANIEASPVPLPLPVAGLGTALLMLGFARRRRA